MSTKEQKSTKLPATRATHRRYVRVKRATGLPLQKLTELAMDAFEELRLAGSHRPKSDSVVA